MNLFFSVISDFLIFFFPFFWFQVVQAESKLVASTPCWFPSPPTPGTPAALYLVERPAALVAVEPAVAVAPGGSHACITFKYLDIGNQTFSFLGSLFLERRSTVAAWFPRLRELIGAARLTGGPDAPLHVWEEVAGKVNRPVDPSATLNAATPGVGLVFLVAEALPEDVLAERRDLFDATMMSLLLDEQAAKKQKTADAVVIPRRPMFYADPSVLLNDLFYTGVPFL